MNTKNFISIILLFIIVFFYFKTYKSYISDKNISNIKKNRENVEPILSENSSKIPTLPNDTNNVIEFNTGYNSEIKKNSNRKFWELLKKDESKSSNN